MSRARILYWVSKAYQAGERSEGRFSAFDQVAAGVVPGMLLGLFIAKWLGWLP